MSSVHTVKKVSWLRFKIGLALLVSASVAGVVGSGYLSDMKSPFRGSNVASFNAESAHRYMGSVGVGRYKIERNIELTYSNSMKENQTQLVTLTYSENVANKLGYVPQSITNRKKLTSPLAAILQSPSFDISPDSENVADSGSPFPVTLNWAVAPKSDGDHILILRIPSILDSQRISVNSTQGGKLVTGSISVPIIVATFWGVGKQTVAIIQGAMAFIGFVLMYPLLHEWIKSKYSRASEVK
jgi:hypothetical protein